MTTTLPTPPSTPSIPEIMAALEDVRALRVAELHEVLPRLSDEEMEAELNKAEHEFTMLDWALDYLRAL